MRPSRATASGAGRPREPWNWKVLAVLIGTAIALVVTEAGLRIADRFGLIREFREASAARDASIWIKSDNPELIYRHRPNYTRDGQRFTERHGILRPSDVTVDPPEGTFRIAALGDSVGAAIRLPYQQRMFTLLEEMLAREGRRRVEVLNFGVNGYGTRQQAALLAELVQGFHPHLVLLQYCVNDFYPTEYPTRWFKDRSSLRLVDLASRLLDRHVVRGYPPAAYWAEMYERDEEGWRSVSAGFKRISDYAHARSSPAVLVIFPAISHGGWHEGDADRRHARVAALAKSMGFEVLDLLPVYARHPVEALRFEPWDTFHPNARGHRIAAAAIADKLLEMGVVP